MRKWAASRISILDLQFSILSLGDYMPLYFLIHDPEFFAPLTTVLAECRRQRSFDPCVETCHVLLRAVRDFHDRHRLGRDESLIRMIPNGLTFDRHCWKELVGEALLYAAVDVPELETLPETLTCLLAPDYDPERSFGRAELPPIQQAHYGSRDLVLGGRVYRPEHVGVNNPADVARLAEYLQGVNPAAWDADRLRRAGGSTDDTDIAEEMAYAREWFPALRELYSNVRDARRLIVCEIL